MKGGTTGSLPGQSDRCRRARRRRAWPSQRIACAGAHPALRPPASRNIRPGESQSRSHVPCRHAAHIEVDCPRCGHPVGRPDGTAAGAASAAGLRIGEGIGAAAPGACHRRGMAGGSPRARVVAGTDDQHRGRLLQHPGHGRGQGAKIDPHHRAAAAAVGRRASWAHSTGRAGRHRHSRADACRTYELSRYLHGLGSAHSSRQHFAGQGGRRARPRAHHRTRALRPLGAQPGKPHPDRDQRSRRAALGPHRARGHDRIGRLAPDRRQNQPRPGPLRGQHRAQCDGRRSRHVAGSSRRAGRSAASRAGLAARADHGRQLAGTARDLRGDLEPAVDRQRRQQTRHPDSRARRRGAVDRRRSADRLARTFAQRCRPCRPPRC